MSDGAGDRAWSLAAGPTALGGVGVLQLYRLERRTVAENWIRAVLVVKSFHIGGGRILFGSLHHRQPGLDLLTEAALLKPRTAQHDEQSRPRLRVGRVSRQRENHLHVNGLDLRVVLRLGM